MNGTSSKESQRQSGESNRDQGYAYALIAVVILGVAALGITLRDSSDAPLEPPVAPTGAPQEPATGEASVGSPAPATRPSVIPADAPRVFSLTGRRDAKGKLWWNGIPKEMEKGTVEPTGASNIALKDYVGAESCKDCHPGNHASWSQHPHRWMNAMATDEIVMGDFSEGAFIEYLGGRATFYMESGRRRMKLERDDVVRIFDINRTIGSRFTQYYVGKLLEGPETQSHVLRQLEHVLPFGWWIDKKEWIPVVHVGEELPDGQRNDPFARPDEFYYDGRCSACHTTKPIGDWMMGVGGLDRFEKSSPHPVSFDVSAYLRENHAKNLPERLFAAPNSNQDFLRVMSAIERLPTVEHTANLGISCEACHHGSREHAENSTKDESRVLPSFFPESPHLRVGAGDRARAWGKTRENLNWTCVRCHSGERPYYAAGMATWNSTEYSDAMKGHCYELKPDGSGPQHILTCVDCHNPHEGIGPKWTHKPKDDDARCLDCHAQFKEESALTAHTHHSSGSAGSRCMNCHMPRINEGMQDMVRTHTIFNPTEPRMIEANHPNACNICHLEETIDWSIGHLRDWYGDEHVYDEKKIAESYPFRSGPVALGWLKNPHEPTRLVAIEALALAKADWALPSLLHMLNDPFLLNRQFTQRRVEEMLGIDLRDLGYRFYMTPAERAKPIAAIKAALLKPEIGRKKEASNGRSGSGKGE